MSELENPAVSRIINYELIIQRFGYWPSFHDAEVSKVTFEAHPGYRATATFLIETHEFINELNKRGQYKQVNNCLVELQFTGIKEMHFDGFDHQNVIFDLAFKESSENIECTFDSSIGLAASIVAEEALVLSLVPVEESDDDPVIDIKTVDMLDSKNIFIASEHLLNNFDWSDWIYVGLNYEQANEYQAEKAAEYAHALFDESEVYLVAGRHDSFTTELSDALSQVSTLLKDKDVLICNKDFSKAMRFRMVGVMSYGRKRS
jgi:hypothetical protein